jgi:peptide/nickel transport system substrate-binding protein
MEDKEMSIDRRSFLQFTGAASAATALPTLLASQSAHAAGDTLTIAYNVSLPSWDPTTGLSSVNPGLQSIWKSVFDQYIDQNPDLSFKPGVLSDWGWNADKTRVHMTVRDGATWQDGRPITGQDIVWNLNRAANPETGNPVGGLIWAAVGNLQANGNEITGDVTNFVADYFKWMAFLTGYILPPHHYEAVGAEGFEKNPMGSGPYSVKEFVRGSFVRLEAYDDYWGGKPAFKNVIFKFVTDATSRVAEIESGSSDITLAMPFEEYDRLREKPGLTGVTTPVSDIAMIFFNDVEPMTDANVRKAAVHAVDKEAIVNRLLHGYGIPLHTLQAPEYAAFDSSINVAYDPDLAKNLLAKSGYTTSNPVKFTIQTTRGYLPKDYEVIQAIVGMWRKVGIEAKIEVYEVAKHYELRAQDTLAPAAFYNWGNSVGDPNDSTGFAMFGPSPHSTWDTDDLDAMIGPLWGEKDEQKRIKGWKAVDRYIAENAYVLPLYQQVQPVIYKDSLDFTPHVANYILPFATRPKD